MLVSDYYIAAALEIDEALESELAQGAVRSVRMRVYVQVASAIRESQMKLWKLPFLPPPQWLPLPGGIDGNPTYSDDRMGNNQGFIFQSIYGDQRIGNNGKKAKKLEERIAISNVRIQEMLEPRIANRATNARHGSNASGALNSRSVRETTCTNMQAHYFFQNV